DDERQQIGIGKIPVVVRGFLGAHRARDLAIGVPEARLLDELAAFAERRDLPPDLGVDRLLDRLERVQVLDLDLGAELLRAQRPVRAISQCVASPRRIASSTTLWLSTGSTPGKPMHTGHVLSLGASPKRVAQPQKIFDAVSICAWTSRPITGS